jgi:hypothetical protein
MGAGSYVRKYCIPLLTFLTISPSMPIQCPLSFLAPQAPSLTSCHSTLEKSQPCQQNSQLQFWPTNMCTYVYIIYRSLPSLSFSPEIQCLCESFHNSSTNTIKYHRAISLCCLYAERGVLEWNDTM